LTLTGRLIRSLSPLRYRWPDLPHKLTQNRVLAHLVAQKLQLQWSSTQIAGWLQRSYPDDESYHVSHETIYRTLFIQARGALKKELLHPAYPRDASFTPSHAEWSGVWSYYRHHLDPRATGRVSRSCGARPLGRRLQRKYERLAQAVLPERNGSIERSPEQVETATRSGTSV